MRRRAHQKIAVPIILKSGTACLILAIFQDELLIYFYSSLILNILAVRFAINTDAVMPIITAARNAQAGLQLISVLAYPAGIDHPSDLFGGDDLS